MSSEKEKLGLRKLRDDIAKQVKAMFKEAVEEADRDIANTMSRVHKKIREDEAAARANAGFKCKTLRKIFRQDVL